MVSVNRLNISGYKGRTLKCRHITVTDETQDVALVFPGLAYNSDMPLLYYSIQTILTSGINVLSVDYDYSSNQDFMKQSTRDRADWLLGDSEAALDFATDDMNQRIVCMMGKSLGTLMLGHFLETREDLRDAKTIWLTPLIKNPELLEQMLAYMKEAVLVIGTSDPHYDSDIIDRLNASTQLSGIIIERANHSLEIEGKVTDSLRVLTQIVSIIRQFLD